MVKVSGVYQEMFFPDELAGDVARIFSCVRLLQFKSWPDNYEELSRNNITITFSDLPSIQLPEVEIPVPTLPVDDDTPF